jgi:hypothetical protein
VTHAQEIDGWSLKLTALSADEPERLVRYLTGALLACGGWVLTRTTQGNQAAELDFEFARASCIEIYAVLIAAGLDLSRDSHLQLADLCHCTRSLINSRPSTSPVPTSSSTTPAPNPAATTTPPPQRDE